MHGGCASFDGIVDGGVFGLRLRRLKAGSRASGGHAKTLAQALKEGAAQSHCNLHHLHHLRLLSC